MARPGGSGGPEVPVTGNRVTARWSSTRGGKEGARGGTLVPRTSSKLLVTWG